MSNLDEDIRMTEALGYGVSYGKYKADHPTQVDVKAPEEDEKLPVCACCGKVIFPSRKGKKYCGKLCIDRVYHNNRNKRLREERYAKTLAE